MKQATTTTQQHSDGPTIQDYLAAHWYDGEYPYAYEYGETRATEVARFAGALKGVTAAEAQALDRFLAECHGCQTEVEVAYADERLHYQTTGPVHSSDDYWHAVPKTAPRVITTRNQWSGYRRIRAATLLVELASSILGGRYYTDHAQRQGMPQAPAASGPTA